MGRSLANVSEAGDIVVFAMALALTLVVGLTLLGVDALVGRLRRTAEARRSARPPGPPL